MLRLRLKRLICFCLTLCLLFCSNMTVFAIEPLEQTKEKYFKFTFEYPIDYFIDIDYSSGGYGDDPSIAVPTNPNQSNYNSFFYKDLLNTNGDMAWTDLVLEYNGTEVIRTDFYDFYNKLNFNNNSNKVDIEADLDFLKSLSNIEDISSLDYAFDGSTLRIIIPHNVSNNANSYNFFSNLTSYINTNSDDSGNFISNNKFTTSDGTVNRLVLNRDLLDNNNIYKGAVMDKSSTANHLSSSYYGSSNLKSFGIDFYFDRNSDDSYSQVCNINFDLYYFLCSKGIIDTTNLYKDITYNDSYTPIIIDSVSEDKYNISNIRFENNKFKFDFSSDKYFTTYTYRLYPDCPDLSNSMLQLVKYYDSTSDRYKFVYEFKPRLFEAPKGCVNLTYFTRNGDALSVGDYLNKDEIYLLDNFKISSADDTNDIGSTYHALVNNSNLVIDIAGGPGSDPDLDPYLANFIDVVDTTASNCYYLTTRSTGTSSGSNFMIAPDRTYKVLDIKKNGNSIILSLESQDYKVTFKDYTKIYTYWDNTPPKEVVKGIDNRLTDSDFPENASDIFLVKNNNSGDYKKITKDEIKNLSEDKEVYYIPKYANIECIHGGTGVTLGELQFPLKENEIVFDNNIIDESTVLYDVSDLPNKIFNGQSYDEWIIRDNNWTIDGHDTSYLVRLANSPKSCYSTSKAYALVQDSLSKCEEVTSINYSGEWLVKWLVDNTSFDRNLINNLINFSVSNKPPIGHNFQSGTPSNITNTITTQEQLTNLINNAESVKLDNQPYTNQAIDLSKVTSIIKTECGRAPEQCTSPKAYEVEIITQASTPPTPPTPPVTPPVTPPSNPHEHTWGTPKKENEKEPTCTKEGSYDLVTRCESCGAELKREHKIIEPLGHIWEDNTWTKLEKSQVNKELFNKAENASKLDFSKLKDTDDVWKRLCSRASDAYELRVVDSDLVGTVSGVLKDKNGKPIANAKVTLHSTPRTVYTNEKGEYKFEDVESGNHTLNVYVSDDSVYQGYIFISNDSTVETVDKSKDYEAIEDAKDTNVTVDINGLDSSNPSGGGDNPSDNPDDGDDPDNPDDVDDPDNPNDFDDPDNPNDFDDPDDFPGDTPEGLPIKVPENTPTDEPDDTPDGRPHKTSDYNIWILYMMLALSIGTLITSVFRGRKKK